MQNTLQLTPVGNMVGILQLHYPVLCYNKQLLASAVSSHLSIEETPSARLSKLENYGFDQLVSQRD